MNFGALAGLANVYPGYQQSRQLQNRIDFGNLDIENAQQVNQAKTALGNALTLIGGSSAGMAPNAPLPPMPGQASVPGGPSGPPPPGGGGLPPPVQMGGGGPQPMLLAGGAPIEPQPGMPPMPGQPSPGGAMPGLPPPAPGMAPRASQPPGGPQVAAQPGSLDWRTLVQAVQQANPGLDGRGVFEAVSQAMPLMNSVAQNEWRGLQLQMQEHRINEQWERMKEVQKGLTDRNINTNRTRADIAASNNAAKLDRLQISVDARRALKELSIESQAEIAKMIDEGKSGRAKLSSETKLELQGLNADLRREITDTLERGRGARLETTEAGKGERTAAVIAGAADRKATDAQIAADRDRARGERQQTAIEATAAEKEKDRQVKQDMQLLNLTSRREIEQARRDGRYDIATLSAKTRADIARMNVDERRRLAEWLDINRDIRFQQDQSRKTDEAAVRAGQADQRIGQGQQRVEQGQARVEQGQQRTNQGQQRLDETRRQAGVREERLERALQLKGDTEHARLQQRAAELTERVKASGGRQGLAEARAAIDAAHKYVTAKIQTQSEVHGLDKKAKAELLLDARRNLDAALDQLREVAGRTTPQPGQGGSKDTGRVPSPPAGAPGVPGAPTSGRPRVTSPNGPPLEWDGQAWVPVQ